MECGISSPFQTHVIKRRGGILFYINLDFHWTMSRAMYKILLKGSEADQYVVKNLMWSGVYLKSILSNTLLQKALTLVPLTATGPEVFVATMTIFLSDYHDALEETLNHMKSLKQKSYPGESVTYCCEAILVDA